MGKSSDAIAEFIEEIPDDKLVGLSDPNPTHTVYQTPDFRLDVQNKTSGDPPMHNIQVQINKGTTISTLKKLNQKSSRNETSVAKALVPTDDTWTAADVRKSLLEGRIV